jgi:protoheme IX farnesyltransferase
MKLEAEIRSAAAARPARLSLRDVVELTKPRLSLLVLLTTVVSFVIAADGAVDVPLLLHTALGTALAAAGASTLNQLFERRHDARMNRTASRPLPTGRVSARDALALGTASAAAGVAYLLVMVNPLTAALGLATVLIYLFAYTPLKRVSPLCTLVGALPGAIPIVMGWTAQTGQVDANAWILFGVLFAWQLPHFLAIAVMYLDDYTRAGFPMRPVVDARGYRSERTLLPPGSLTGWTAIGWAGLLLAVTASPHYSGLAGGWYLIGAAALGLVYLAASVSLAIQRTRRAACVLFITSIAYLPLLLIWLALNKA